jgi:hypothetical protein
VKKGAALLGGLFLFVLAGRPVRTARHVCKFDLAAGLVDPSTRRIPLAKCAVEGLPQARLKRSLYTIIDWHGFGQKSARRANGKNDADF